MERYLNKMSHEGWQCLRDRASMSCALCAGKQDEYDLPRTILLRIARRRKGPTYLRTLGETGAALVGEYGEAC